jgi:hypothetical protein
MKMKRKLRVGDWVEVRSKDEILRTLDGNGRLDGMAFMPEMIRFCGQRFQVYKRAHKTCDYTTSYPYRTRRLSRTVHLETRCDGEAHGGCQASCLLYWKEAWLKPVPRSEDLAVTHPKIPSGGDVNAVPGVGCSESDLWANTEAPDPNSRDPRYLCQATQVPYATTYLAWWDLRQYFEDYWSGNVGIGRIISAFVYSTYYHLSEAGIGVGRAMRWLYDKFYPVWGGTLFPRKPGLIPEGAPTPMITLNLRPGELVRVKPHLEILKSVDAGNRNRGMYWDAELVPYCGGTYQILRRVSKIIDEKTGKMVKMKNPCIVLDTVVCQARYSQCRMLCPKSMYPYWREIWLERVESNVHEETCENAKMATMSSGQR